MLSARYRWRDLVGAFLAVLIGVAVVALATLLYAAGRPEVPGRLAGAPVVVQSPTADAPADQFHEPVPWSAATAAGLVERLTALPGVTAAVADRSFYAQLPGDERTVRGHGWSSAALGGYRLYAGAPPTGPGEVVLDRRAGLTPGAQVTVLTATGPASYTVSGTLDGPGLYVTDALAATLAPGVRAVGLTLAPGTDPAAVAGAARAVVAGNGSVLTGDARSALEPRSDARTRWIGMQVLSATAALAGFVSVFVVASTFAFVVAQRRREFALLRTIGATPRQVRRSVYVEAALVGAVAAGCGVLLGAAVAPAVGAVLVDVGFEPATYTVRLTALPLAGSLALGPVVALLGAGLAARRAARVHPLEALREAAAERRPMGRVRWVLGVLLVAAGLASAVGIATADDIARAAPYALYAAMALVLGAAALAPVFVPVVAALLAGPFTAGPVGSLVRAEARTAARRTASVAAPVLLTFSFAVLVSGMVQTSTRAYGIGRAAAVDAGYVLAPDSAPGLSDAAVTAAPGAAVLPTTVYVTDSEPRDALGVDAAAFADVNNRLKVVSGSVADLQGPDTVVLTESAAARYGPLVRVTFADGESVPLRVVAVVSDGSAPVGLVLPRSTVRAHDPSALTSVVYLARPVPVPAGSGARLVDTVTHAREADAAEDRLVWVATLLLIGVSAGYGALAVANTLLLAARHRRANLRVLRLVGATDGQLLRLLAAEAVLVVTVGALLGGAVAGVALLGIRAGLAEQVGAPVALVVPWSVVAAVVGGCLLLAVLAGVTPVARRAASGD